nr:hypothetical protein [Alphaproteobacteria bacterium]
AQPRTYYAPEVFNIAYESEDPLEDGDDGSEATLPEDDAADGIDMPAQSAEIIDIQG